MEAVNGKSNNGSRQQYSADEINSAVAERYGHVAAQQNFNLVVRISCLAVRPFERRNFDA